MGANIDDAKGRMKEAAGALTDDKDLKTEGKADQIGAKVKGLLGTVKERAEGAVDAVKEKLAENKNSSK
jgi:uncharacterized protein YjbJ (UPF0337 family)